MLGVMILQYFAYMDVIFRFLVKSPVLHLTINLYELHLVLWALLKGMFTHLLTLIQGSQVVKQRSSSIYNPFYCLYGFELIIFPIVTVHVRIVDPSKDLNSYGLGNVDWKERVEGWKLKQDKNMMQMTNRYSEGKGDMEGTGSNGDELQM